MSRSRGELVIRAYRAPDRDRVAGLVRGVLAEHGFAIPAERLEADLAEARDPYVRGVAGFWVGELGSELAGTVALRHEDERTCELKRFYLLVAHRGRGHGRALLDAALRFARGAGYRTMRIESSRRFTRAHDLYARSGFVVLAHIANEWEDMVLEKRLD